VRFCANTAPFHIRDLNKTFADLDICGHMCPRTKYPQIQRTAVYTMRENTHTHTHTHTHTQSLLTLLQTPYQNCVTDGMPADILLQSRVCSKMLPYSLCSTFHSFSLMENNYLMT
jgi:hypothetical protein